MTRPFVLSIRPTFIERILSGHKTVELRVAAFQSCSRVLGYFFTQPPRCSPSWHSHGSILSVKLQLDSFGSVSAMPTAVTRQEFDTYFDGTNSGCALTLGAVRRFERPIHLTHLERQFEFCPPQWDCYWKESLLPLATHGRVKAFT